jgi:hypothetical protein
VLLFDKRIIIILLSNRYIKDLRYYFGYYNHNGKPKSGINEYKTKRKKIIIGKVYLNSKESFKINTYTVIIVSYFMN